MKRKGIKWILVGLVIFLVGIVALPFGVILPLLKNDTEELQFRAPASEVRFQAPEKGRYYLWNQHQTTFEGQAYFGDENPPAALQIEVSNAQGQKLPFHLDTSTSMSRIGSSKSSLGYVDLEEPSDLKWSATGFEGERIFSISQDQFTKFLVQVAIAVVGMFLIVFVGGLSVLWGVFQVVCSKIPRAKAWLESDLPFVKKILNILNNR